MASNVGSGKGKGMSNPKLHEGLKRSMPKDGDKSMKMGGKSVNADTTRSSVAKGPKNR